MATGAFQSATYPIQLAVEPQITGRNRVTCFFRLILAIPHMLLVGSAAGIGLGIPIGYFAADGNSYYSFGNAGVIGAVASIMSVVSWVVIVLAGKDIKGLRDFRNYYLRWRVRVFAYTALLRDEYPPFGDGEYPLTWSVADESEKRDRLSVFLRLIFAIPHFIVLFFVGIAWLVTYVIAWFAILFTGNYPESLYNFGVGYMRWAMRVECYLLLMQDEYPPFTTQ